MVRLRTVGAAIDRTLRVSRACSVMYATCKRRRQQAMLCLRVRSTAAGKVAAKDAPVDALVDAPYADAVKDDRESWPEVC